MLFIVLGISLFPTSFGDAYWGNLKVDIDKAERISGENSDIILIKAEFTNNDNEQISIYYDYVRLDDSKNREFAHSNYWTLQEKGHDITERECPWEYYIELNPGISEDGRFCFEVPKEKLTFTFHLYESYLDWCKNPSWGSCQEKTVRLSIRDPDPEPPPAPTSSPSSGSTSSTPIITSRGDIAIARGSSVPGCEESRSCYIPYRLDVGKGSIVTWHNTDSSAHTVTSGNPDFGADGYFDSSLMGSDTTFSFEFTRDGVFNYYCMVHPWMTGQINVQRSGTIIGKPVDNTPKDTTPPKMLKPVDIEIDAENQNGARITFEVLAIDDTDQIIRPSCNPSSGSLFGIGSTTVTCNAMDSAGNMAIPVSFTVTVNPTIVIPSWVRNVASFWCAGNIDDDSFIEGIKYLIDNKIIIVPTASSRENPSQEIPDWVKNNACWWSEGRIADNDFSSGIQYLVTNGIITIKDESKPQPVERESDTSDNSASFPKISQRLDGEYARETITDSVAFHKSLSKSEREDLANQNVNDSQFVIGLMYSGDWMLVVTEHNFEFKQHEGSGISVIPFDCSHNMDYIYSIVGSKIDETGTITLVLFKNGVMIDHAESEKPYGTASMAGVCDEPTIMQLD